MSESSNDSHDVLVPPKRQASRARKAKVNAASASDKEKTSACVKKKVKKNDKNTPPVSKKRPKRNLRSTQKKNTAVTQSDDSHSSMNFSEFEKYSLIVDKDSPIATVQAATPVIESRQWSEKHPSNAYTSTPHQAHPVSKLQGSSGKAGRRLKAQANASSFSFNQAENVITEEELDESLRECERSMQKLSVVDVSSIFESPGHEISSSHHYLHPMKIPLNEISSNVSPQIPQCRVELERLKDASSIVLSPRDRSATDQYHVISNTSRSINETNKSLSGAAQTSGIGTPGGLTPCSRMMRKGQNVTARRGSNLSSHSRPQFKRSSVQEELESTYDSISKGALYFCFLLPWRIST